MQSDELSVLTVEEMGAALGISRASAYRACQKGIIPHKRVGKRIIIEKSVLKDWLRGSEPVKAAL
jgi:excisionase family DNA binding protein